MDSKIIEGTVDFVKFRNDDNGFSILNVIPDDNEFAYNANGTLTVVGSFPQGLDVGESATFEGYFTEHEKFGIQLKVMGYEKIFREPPVELSTTQNQSQMFGNGTPKADEVTLRGSIERVTFYNPENGWTVAKIAPYEDTDYDEEAVSYDGLIAVTGVMPELADGMPVEFTGRWVHNEQYGKQFKATQAIPVAPDNKDGIIRYIADTVFGIGEVTATRIYNHFGDKTMEILDDNPEAIRQVSGLKHQLQDNLIEVWKENRVERNIMVHLQSYGITSRMAKRIYSEYGSEALGIVNQNPYQLAEDLHGIGFRKADDIAGGLGIPHDSPYRVRAGLVYALSEWTNEGHTYAPTDVLIEQAAELLGVEDKSLIETQIQEQILAQRLRADTLLVDGEEIHAIYLTHFYAAEKVVSETLRLMADSPSRIISRMKDTNWERYLADLAKANNVQLTPQQQSAVQAALSSKISVLTGGPGTGKTTTLRMVINALDEEGITYKLASPTGRAAKRLGEATEQEATTIHRMLGWNPMEARFEFDEDNPLPVDMLVIDEASMIDLQLFHRLLNALRVGTHLLLVGDVDQLPSVGAGNVLNDVINSGIGHVTRLNQIFRQQDSSHIVTNAHRINQGNMPISDNDSEDFFFFKIDDPMQAASMIVNLVTTRLEKKVGDYDRLNDVQVIAPMYRGQIGVNALNQALQEALNPPKTGLIEKRLGGRVFRKGDKVMQTKNNYEKEVFNGDIGIIHAIDPDERVIQVVIDGAFVNYNYDDAEEQLIHAYCISTHRSQGSEYPIVVMPLMTQHYMMLQRNLIYTAITRAKRMVVLVGTHKAMFIAVNNNKVAERYSGLLPRLLMSPSNMQETLL